jgi:hypothetical protein
MVTTVAITSSTVNERSGSFQLFRFQREEARYRNTNAVEPHPRKALCFDPFTVITKAHCDYVMAVICLVHPQ